MYWQIKVKNKDDREESKRWKILTGARKTNKDRTRQGGGRRERERGGDKQLRREVKRRRGTSGKRAAHLPDGSFGSMH